MRFARFFRRLLDSYPAGRQPVRRRAAAGAGRFVLERLEDRTVPTVSILNNGGNGYAGLDFGHSGGYVPPDTCAAAGPSVDVETVNQTLAIYNPKSTGASAVTDSFSHFLFTSGGLTRADSGSGLSDPIVSYDEQIGRFIIGDQDVNFSTHVSAFDLAVSKTSNPTDFSIAKGGGWCGYEYNTGEALEDYPKLGLDPTHIILGTNSFNAVSEAFVSAHIFAGAKPTGTIEECPAAPELKQFGSPLRTSVGIPGNLAFTPEPAKEKRGFKTQFGRSSGQRDRSERKCASGTAGCLKRGSECFDQRKYQFGWPAQDTSIRDLRSNGSFAA